MKHFVYALVVVLTVSGCAYNDHSRNYNIDAWAEDDGWIEMVLVVRAEKGDTEEESTAEAKGDGELTTPLGGFL